MSTPIAHTIFTLLQQITPAEREAVLQMINDEPQKNLSALHVAKNGVIERSKKTMQELLKTKVWDKHDRKNAAEFVKLPNNLKSFLTQKNML